MDKVCGAFFNDPTMPFALTSASRDGTIRKLDITKETFELIYCTEDSWPDSGLEYVGVGEGAAANPSLLYLAGTEGAMGVVDTRSKKKLTWYMDGHDKKCNSLIPNPANPNHLVTASLDRSVRLWDARMIGGNKDNTKSLLWSLDYSLSCNNAIWSPTGSHLVVTCMDHHLYVYDTDSLLNDHANKTIRKSIRHNNHTGRWLTKFMPAFDPHNPDVFAIGSMESPRRIELYSCRRAIQIGSLQDPDYLGSVQSLLAFHPHSPFELVGANSSGRLHYFHK